MNDRRDPGELPGEDAKRVVPGQAATRVEAAARRPQTPERPTG